MKDKKKRYDILLLIAVAVFLIHIDTVSARSRAESPALGPQTDQKVPKTFKTVHSLILQRMERTGVASVAIAVTKDGKTLWEQGFGWADREKKIKAAPDTIYHLASISKAMTATGLMVLVERGLVDLSRPANDYLGKAKLIARMGSADEATVRRLLFHTAGLPMYWNFFDMDGPNRRPAMDESISRYGILMTAPGETYTYSNFGYGIIDYIISKVSGRDYPEFMKDEVFRPLGMMQSSVQTDSPLNANVAQMYGAGRKAIPPYDFDHRGASAVLASVRDLIRFGVFHSKKPLPDQRLILKDETIDRMHRETYSQIPGLKDRIGFDYLLGSFADVDYGGHRLEVTTGSMPGTSSRLALVPSENIVTAILCNGDNIDLWEIEKAVLETLLPGLKEKAKNRNEESSEGTAFDPNPPESFLGTWSGRLKTYTGTIPATLAISDCGKIRLEINGKPATPLQIKTPLGEMGFLDNVFRALFTGSIPTPDAARAPHILLLECRRRNDRLTGYAAAVAVNKIFCLPYWIELNQAQEKIE